MPYRFVNDVDSNNTKVNSSQLPLLPDQQEEINQSQPLWSSLLGEATRIGAKGISSLLGLPGDIGHLASQLSSSLGFANPDEMINKLEQSVPKEGIQTPFGLLTNEKYEGPPPLSSQFYFENIYKPLVSDGYPDNFAKAQSNIGEALDIIGENFSLSSLLGGGPSISNLVGSAGVAAGNQLAKMGGFGPTGQAVAGIVGGTAAQALPSFWNAQDKLKEIYRQKFAQRDELAKSLSGDASNLGSELIQMHTFVDKHGIPSSNIIKDRIEKIYNLIAGGNMSLEDAVTQERILNDWIYNKDLDKTARKYILDIKDKLTKFIQNTGTPEFLEIHKDAKNLWAAVNGSGFISNIINSLPELNAIAKNPFTKYILGGLGLAGSYISPARMVKPLATLAVGYGAKGIFKALNSIVKDKTARTLYAKILGDATSGKLALASKDAIKNVERFDKYITNKTEKKLSTSKKKFKFID